VNADSNNADSNADSNANANNAGLNAADAGAGSGGADVDAAPRFRCPVSFVDTVEQLKWAHASTHVGQSLAYFEADMVIQPGAGEVGLCTLESS
jgi:hypothetical protein